MNNNGVEAFTLALAVALCCIPMAKSQAQESERARPIEYQMKAQSCLRGSDLGHAGRECL